MEIFPYILVLSAPALVTATIVAANAKRLNAQHRERRASRLAAKTVA